MTNPYIFVDKDSRNHKGIKRQHIQNFAQIFGKNVLKKLFSMSDAFATKQLKHQRIEGYERCSELFKSIKPNFFFNCFVKMDET